MKSLGKFVMKALFSGFLIAVPVYLAVLLVLKAMKSVMSLVKPLAVLHPPGVTAAVAENALALIAVMTFCFALGLAVRTPRGRMALDRFERNVLAKIPGYLVARNLTRQMAGQGQENVWKPALVEIEDGLVPAFIIEENRDGGYTVFVPSVPSPLAGAVYIFRRERVHPVSATFAQTFQALTKWGSGAGELVAMMEPNPKPTLERSRARRAREQTLH